MTDARQPTDSVPARDYAAMFVAVAWLRGALPDVVLGEIDREHLQRVLAATAAESIARILGKTEMDMFLDLDQYLTEDEKHMIGGD